MSQWNAESPGGCLRPFFVSALACASLAAGCASQTRWTQLVERNAVTYYYDASSMRRPANLEVRIKVLRENPSLTIDPLSGDPYRSALYDWEIHCAEKSVLRYSTNMYTGSMASGRNITDTGTISGSFYADPQTLSVMKHQEDRTKPERIISGSIEEEVMKRFCR